MIYIKILVEGEAEEVFVGEVLKPHLIQKEIFPEVVLLGGYAKYHTVKKDIQIFLHQQYIELVTTMIDFFKLPKNYPGFDTIPHGTCYERIPHLEHHFREDINHSKFLPYLSLHEFEVILFASPQAIADQFPTDKPIVALQKIRNAFSSPEEINEEQPPSKRIKALLPAYDKQLHRKLIASSIGLKSIRQQCPHFNEWLTKLENLNEST